MSYGRFINEESGDEYGSFEVFYIDHAEALAEILGEDNDAGWYWWACFPGCLPDGEPHGPFETEEQAYADARDE
jgi:hypothetical protein